MVNNLLKLILEMEKKRNIQITKKPIKISKKKETRVKRYVLGSQNTHTGTKVE